MMVAAVLRRVMTRLAQRGHGRVTHIPVEAVMMMFRAAGALARILPSMVAMAADYPAPKEEEWIARDFKFHTGEVMPQLKLHYTTIGGVTRPCPRCANRVITRRSTGASII